MNIHYTTQFKKDYKRIKKQNKNLVKLRTIIENLVTGKTLESEHKERPLQNVQFRSSSRKAKILTAGID